IRDFHVTGVQTCALPILELVHKTTIVAFDKTGTLTVGQPTLVESIPFSLDQTQLLKLSAALQMGSEHPLARAIVQIAEQQQVSLPIAQNVQALPGRGVAALVEGRALKLGNTRLMNELEVDLSALADAAAALENQGN